jgi:hypothetical protein
MSSPSPKAKKTVGFGSPAQTTPDRKPSAGPGTPGRGLLPREYGNSYMTFNPGMLDDKDLFTKKTLKKICDNVKIKADGLDRAEMIAKLRKWHSLRLDGKKGQKGTNFSFLQVRESEMKMEYKSPFKKHNNFDTPRSILKRSSRFASPPAAKTPQSRALKTPKSRASAASSDNSDVFQSPMSPSEYEAQGEASEVSPKMQLPEAYCAPPSPSTPAPGATPASKKRARICFSPYNQVQIMSPCRSTPEEKEESPEEKSNKRSEEEPGSNVSRKLSVGSSDSDDRSNKKSKARTPLEDDEITNKKSKKRSASDEEPGSNVSRKLSVGSSDSDEQTQKKKKKARTS